MSVPRPVVGETYDPNGFQMTVQAVDDLHVVCSCPECEPGIKPCETSQGRGHVFTRRYFFEHFTGYGPFTT